MVVLYVGNNKKCVQRHHKNIKIYGGFLFHHYTFLCKPNHKNACLFSSNLHGGEEEIAIFTFSPFSSSTNTTTYN